MEEGRGVYRVLVGKPQGKTPFGRSRCRWEEKMKKEKKKVRCWNIDRIEQTQDRDRWRALVNAVMNLPVL
jgi:hypothetical protein